MIKLATSFLLRTIVSEKNSTGNCRGAGHNHCIFQFTLLYSKSVKTLEMIGMLNTWWEQWTLGGNSRVWWERIGWCGEPGKYFPYCDILPSSASTQFKLRLRLTLFPADPAIHPPGQPPTWPPTNQARIVVSMTSSVLLQYNFKTTSWIL